MDLFLGLPDTSRAYENSNFWVSLKNSNNRFSHDMGDHFSFAYLSIAVAFKEFRSTDELLRYKHFINSFSTYANPNISYYDLPSSFFEHPLNEQDLDLWLKYIDDALAIWDALIVKDTPGERVNSERYPEVQNHRAAYDFFWYYRIKDEYSDRLLQYSPFVLEHIGADGDNEGYISFEEPYFIVYIYANMVFQTLNTMKQLILEHRNEGWNFWMYISDFSLYKRVIEN